MKRAWLMLLASVALSVLVVVHSMGGANVLGARRSLESARTHLAQLRSENDALQRKAAMLSSPSVIEHLAHSQYGLVKPGEQVYEILPGPAAPQPSTSPPVGPSAGAA
ncbi:MAG: septum formation initiator family protein [Actinobacteria bacterium]|nr:septum formation initiator family protein [Actinomycetota bacterium]